MNQSNHPRNTLLALGLLAAFVMVLLALAVQPSQAAVGDLTFTIEAPGVQASQVSCNDQFHTEDFDAPTPGNFSTYDATPLGNYNEGSSVFLIDAFDDFGGAGGSGNYINTNGANSYILTLDNNSYPDGAGYFGFWWSAGNGNNRVKVNMADGSSQTFSTQAILDSGNLETTGGPTGSGHFGNPNNDANPDEVYAYVNIFAQNNDARIVSLEFSEITGSVGFFESDNHTACNDLLDESGTPIEPVVRVTVCVEDSQNNNISSDPKTQIFYKLGGFTYFLSTDTDANGCRYQDFSPSSNDIEVWVKHNFTESAHQTADLSQDRTFNFATQPMTLRLETCEQQQPLDGGVPRYKGDSLWFWPGNVQTTTGSGSNNPGEVVGEVFPGGTFDFDMTYNFTRQVKSGVTIQDPPQTLIWQTTQVTLFWPGQIIYYDAGGFTHFFKSSTSDPSATKELLPGTYKFEFKGVNGNPGFTTWLTFDGCSYSNQDLSLLTVEKVADPQDGTDFPFTLSGALVQKVLYREIFPLGDYGQVTQGARQNALDEGWRGYWDGRIPEANIPAPQNTTSLQIFPSGSPNIEEAINSNPVNSGEGNAFWSPSESRVILYTEEFSFPRADLFQIYYETRHNDGDQPQQDFPLLKIDGDWYSPDCQFVNTDVAGNAVWLRTSWPVNDVTWMKLDIDPATNRAVVPGQDCVDTGDFDPPLATGLDFASLGTTVEAFGLYLPDPESVPQANMRFDNYTFIGRVSPHDFILDDADPDDGDEYMETMSFFVAEGDVTVTEQVPAGWSLADITCEARNGVDPAANDGQSVQAPHNFNDPVFEKDLDNGQVTISNLVPPRQVRCTFFNEEEPVAIKLVESFAVSRVFEGLSSGPGSKACYWVTSTVPLDGKVVIDIAPQGGQVTVDRSQVTLYSSNYDNLGQNGRSNFVCIRAVNDPVDDSGAQVCKEGSADLYGAPPIDSSNQECGDHQDFIQHTIASSTDSKVTTSTPFMSNNTVRDLDNNPSTVDALVVDDDEAGVILTESFAVSDLDEDGSPVGKACYWITLASQPAGPVQVGINGDSEVDATKTQVTLDAGNWNQLDPGGDSFNRVCITPVDESDIDKPVQPQPCRTGSSTLLGQGGDGTQVCGTHLGYVSHSVSSSDAKYNNTTSFSGNAEAPDFDNNQTTIDVLVRNDDAPNPVFNPATINVLEGGQASFEVSLSSRPKAEVTVSDASNKLTFQPGNWNVPQRVTVRVPQDNTAEAPQTLLQRFTLSSSDPDFDGVKADPVEVTVVDDDNPGVLLSSTEVAVREGRGQAVYTVKLTSRPAAAVSVALSGDEQLSVEPAGLVFDGSNWSKPQWVTVRAADDRTAELAIHSGRISHNVSSGDAAYDGLEVSAIEAAVTDNDTAGIAFRAVEAQNLAPQAIAPLQVGEGGEAAVYAVNLTSQPVSAVTVAIDGGGQVSAEPTALTFTPQNWDQAQQVKVSAVDDAVDEGGRHAAALSHRAASDDAFYDGLQPEALPVKVNDNDDAGVLLSRAKIEAATGARPTYTLRLASEPAAEVAIDLAASGNLQAFSNSCDDGEGGASCVVFTPENWDAPQTVTVVVLGPGEVAHQVSSADPFYNGLAVKPVAVNATYSIYMPVARK